MTRMNIELVLDSGSTLVGKIGTIASTELGPEDDFRFVWAKVELALSTGVQAYCPMLGNPDKPTLNVHKQIIGITNAAGVRTWEQLPGRSVVALYDPTEARGPIIGICSLDGMNIHLSADLDADASTS